MSQFQRSGTEQEDQSPIEKEPPGSIYDDKRAPARGEFQDPSCRVNIYKEACKWLQDAELGVKSRCKRRVFSAALSSFCAPVRAMCESETGPRADRAVGERLVEAREG